MLETFLFFYKLQEVLFFVEVNSYAKVLETKEKMYFLQKKLTVWQHYHCKTALK